MTAKKIKWEELTVAEATEQFENKLGIEFVMTHRTNKPPNVDLKFKRGNKGIRKALREAYCKFGSCVFLQVAILRHPNCPKDVKRMDKIIEEL